MGAIVLRVKYEATGTDLIINKAFWLDVPHLIKVMSEFDLCIYQVASLVPSRSHLFVLAVCAYGEGRPDEES